MNKTLTVALLAGAISASVFARDVNVRDFGAKGDGVTFDTESVQRAIDECSSSGGGRVVLSGGVFRIRPIRLKSGVDLHIDIDARILGSNDWKDYPNKGDMRHVDSSKLPRARDAALITADEARGIAISGRGTIDACGHSFVRPLPKSDKPKRWKFERIGGFECSPPRVVFFTGCSDVTVKDVTMTNQPAGWSYWIHDCDRVVFDAVKVLADVRYPNNDGIHINCSRDVSISNCRVETGDDSIVVRANGRSLPKPKPCERVTVVNCQLRSYANCIRLGWTMDGVIRDCTFSNIVMHDSSVGINIWLPPKFWNPAGDFGVEPTLIENVVFSGIVMNRIHDYPITARVYEPCKETCKALRNIVFSDVISVSAAWPEFIGCPERHIKDFRFVNCRFDRSDAPEVRSPCEVEVEPTIENREFKFKMEHCDNFMFDKCYFYENGRPVAGPMPQLTPPRLVGDGVADDTDAIQARLDSGLTCVYLPPPEKEYLISKTLRMGSNQELRLDRFTRIRLAPFSNCSMLANRDPKNGNKNISVTGGIWDNDNMRQYPAVWLEQHIGKDYAVDSKIPKGAKKPEKYDGFLMDFRKVDGFTMRSLTLRNPTTFGFRGERVINFTIDDITFDYSTFNPIRACQDGVHFDGGSRFGRVSNLKGACWDDLLAFNSNDTDHTDAEGEPISDITVDGIYSEGCHSAVRLLSTGGDVRNITLRNIHGTFYSYAVGLTHFFSWTNRPRGRFDNIAIENCSVAKCVQPKHVVANLGPMEVVRIEGRLDLGSVRISGLTRVEQDLPQVPTIGIGKGARVENLSIYDCTQINRTAQPMEFLHNEGTVSRLIKKNIRLVDASGKSVLLPDEDIRK